MTGSRFTQRVQLLWIGLLVVTLLGIGQAFSFGVYRLAIVAMLVGGVGQIAIGNVPPGTSRRGFFRYLGVFSVVIAVIFGVSIPLIPYLVNLGR